MKKNGLLVVAVFLVVLCLAAPSIAWQGRMAGIGDTGGLVEDESDFLTHPAAIAAGKGFNAYGFYRLTYDKATNWDYTLRIFGGGANNVYPYTTSGYSWKNEGQLGAAFQLGAGRMGVFFDYTGVRGKYNGDEKFTEFSNHGDYPYDLKNVLDNFAVKVIYGLPVGAVNLGGEFQIAYRNEEQQTYLNNQFVTNYMWAAENNPAADLYPFMIPYKSKYWEAQGKISATGSAGPAKYAITLKGGLPFASDNGYDKGAGSYTMEGKVAGFNVGGDFWLRMPLNDRMVLPFVVSAGYKSIKRDGVYDAYPPWVVTYEQKTQDLFVKVGGGLDMTPAKGTKVAAGLYYDFMRTNQSLYATDLMNMGFSYLDDYTDMPKYTEHRLTLKAMIEKEVCSKTVLRGGVNVFYGIVKSDYAYAASDDFGPYLPLSVSADGSNLGVNVSAGATVAFDRVSLEPFLNAGYAKYQTSGDGTFGSYAANIEFEKTNWLVGGGLSVKF